MGTSGKKIKIGIVICGGCNPTFDRSEMLAYIKNYFAESVEFSFYDSSKDHQLILLINGCLSECLLDTLPEKTTILINTGDRELAVSKLQHKIDELN